MKITVSTEVDRPLSAIWRWYAIDHVRNHPRWDPEMELEPISDGPIGLGARIRRRNRHFDVPVEGEMEIVEWQPEQAMGVQIRDADRVTNGRVTFDALSPDRTRLTIEADYPGMDEVTAGRIRPLIERTGRNIRQLLESEA